jgi:DNA-binding response OmpR family regulator
MTRAGLGTAVQILLPAPVLNKVALEMEAAEEPAAAGAQHLLLVDDEPFLLLIWKTALEQAGYVVYGAGTADEAFALFKKEKSKIKCAIIDVQLLDSSGTELAKKILPLKQIPIIMTSGLQPDGMTMSVIEASRGRFVLKPVGISKLLQVIKSVI